MQKIDVYSLESGLERLKFLNELPSVLIGYQKLKRGDFLGFETGRDVEMIKIEAYYEQVPDGLIDKIDQIPTVVGTHYSPRTEISLDSITLVPTEETVKAKDVVESNTGAIEPDNGTISIEAKGIAGGKSVFSIIASKKLGFLYKVFGVFAQNDISLFKGSCCPKGDQIMGRFFVNRMNTELLSYIEDELKRVLSLNTMGNGGYKKFVRQDMKTSTLSLSFDTSGSLPSIKVSADSKELLIRYQVQGVLTTFDLEVSIGRIGSRGGMLDDKYYLRSTKNSEIDQSLINELETVLYRN